MNRKYRIASYGYTLAVITVLMLLASCSGFMNRTPEKWLSLSYVGLTSIDQYAYTGSLQITTANGIEFIPQTFEGKVVDHQQLNVQTDGDDPLLLNPIKVLEHLSKSNSVKVTEKEQTSNTVTLLVEESGAEAKEQWSELLRQKLRELANKSPLVDGEYKQQYDRELAASSEQLEAMLQTLSTQTNYELVIDRNRMLPLKLEEHTTFSYEYKGQPKSENRLSNVRFQSFDGSASKTVQ